MVGTLSLVDRCERGEVHVVDLGPCGTSTSAVWEEAIKNAAGGRLVAYMDGSRDDDGRVGGGWYADGNRAGSIAVGNVATI